MEFAITAKGQATIPKAIREQLRLKHRVKFFVHPDGSVLSCRNFALWPCGGIVKLGRRPVTIEE